MFELLRAIYRRLRSVPVLGSIIVGLRQGVFPRFSTGRQRYEQQQAIIEAHSAALAGLRQALASANEAKHFEQQQAIIEAHSAAIAGLRQSVARAESATVRAENAVRAAQGELPKHVEDLNARLEFARQELFFELRQLTGKSAPSGRDGPASAIKPHVVDLERVAAHRKAGSIKLNVGCGHKPDADRINVDMRPMPGVDVVATVADMPFDPGEVDQIYSAHLMEHFPREEMRRTILPYWITLLKSGGEMRAVVPDAAAMIDGYNSGTVDFETLRLITYGGQEYEGDFHHTMFTPESLVEIFENAGLSNVRIVERGRRNGLCFECEIAGTKP